MINNTLFRSSVIRADRRNFNPEGFDLAAVLKERQAKKEAEKARKKAEKIATIKGKLSVVRPTKEFVSADGHRDAFIDVQPVELTANSSYAELGIVIQAAYRQVFGNAHLMESERSLEAESQLRSGMISVLEFIRQLAKSDRYRLLFFERCSNLRTIELNFKHLLGRAPESQKEISDHIRILTIQGFEAEIDSYLDGDEYFRIFGAMVVPYHRGYQTQSGNQVSSFTHFFQLLRGSSTSDKAALGNSQLQQALLGNKPTQIQSLSTVPESAWKLSPLPTPEAPPEKYTFNDLSCVPRYKSPEFLATPLRPNDWLRQYKARKAAETFPMASRSQPVILASGASAEAVDLVIKAAYKQVFGNAHLMESQRLLSAEENLKDGKITVKSFVRALAKSDFYRSRFFETCPNVRAVELNFKHLLGRAPDSFQEVSKHISILLERGFEAEIDSYLSCDEYRQNFGEYTIPYYVGYASQKGKNVAGYNRLLQLNKDACNSDLSIAEFNQKPQIQSSLLAKPVLKQAPIFNPKGFDLAKALGFVSAAEAEKRRVPSIAEPYTNAFIGNSPIEWMPNASVEQQDLVIAAAYKQVFGNAHLMESERCQAAESQMRNGQITVLDFVRQLAKSERYRVLFFENYSNLRFIELNFKHLLGRSPETSNEISKHIQILNEEGFDAEIDSHIDSDEYFQAFGVAIVPYYRGYQTQVGKNITGFVHSFQLLRGASSSDKSIPGIIYTQLDDALLGDRHNKISELSKFPEI